MGRDDGLIIKNLSLAFRGLKALDDVSLNVAAGEIVGLIGPNGAGKTSMLNCVSRFYKPQSGEILFNGLDLSKYPAHRLVSLGISRSFQELDLQEGLTVMDNLLIGCGDRGKALETMRFLGECGYFDLRGVADEPIGTLPYAIKKAADLARALASSPRLLLLDEPAGGLSGADLTELGKLIREVAVKFKTSILLIEHKMPLVMSLCDRIVVLDFGKKIAEGRPAEIKQDPAVIEAYLGKKSAPREATVTPIKRLQPDVTRPLLEIRNINVDYGPVRALSGVTLQVPEFGVTAVLGSNGAGKSTLLKAVSGIAPVSSGEIHFQEQPIVRARKSPRSDWIVRKGVVQVAEGRRIFRESSVMENLRLAAYTCPHRLKDNLEKVFHYFPKLKDKLNAGEAGNLSGGEQQMLAVGQALMMQPKLLLLDEPSLGLAPALVEEVFAIIERIAIHEKCSILIVEQNVEKALSVASYGYVLEGGCVVKHGPAAQLAENEDIKNLYFG